MTVVAYQGEPGAYGEQGLPRLCPDAEHVPVPSIRRVFEAVEVGRVDYGLVPMDNSQAGSITETYDFFLKHGLHLVGETVVRVDHCLLALAGSTLDDLEEVISHPQAISQSEEFLNALGVRVRADYKTAGAAKRITEEGLRGRAAIASRSRGRPRAPGSRLGRPDDRARRSGRAVGGDVRLTRQQNLVVTNVPERGVDEVVAELEAIGFPLTVNHVRAGSIACTGEPHCNFSVTETKGRLDRLIRLEERFGTRIAELRLNLDGCPHACAQHSVGDLGFQGTTGRDEEGRRRQALRRFRPRRPRPGRRDRSPALPARVYGGARRGNRRARRGLARPPRRRRVVHRVRPAAQRRGAGRAGGPRTGEAARTRGGVI